MKTMKKKMLKNKRFLSVFLGKKPDLWGLNKNSKNGQVNNSCRRFKKREEVSEKPFKK